MSGEDLVKLSPTGVVAYYQEPEEGLVLEKGLDLGGVEIVG